MSNPIAPSQQPGYVGPQGERRLHARSAINCPASLRTPFSLTAVKGRLVDISHGGAAFVCSQTIKSGDGYALLLDRPAGGAATTQLSVGTTVLQCQPIPNAPQQFRVNLRFTATNDALRAFIDHHNRRPG